MTELTVGVTTWVKYPIRLAYLEQSMRLCRERLDLKGLSVRYVVSAESQDTPEQNKESLQRLCEQYGYELVWNNRPADLGANLNNLWEHVRTPIMLYVQDDYAPEVPIPDIVQDVDFLASRSDIGIVRYPYHKEFCDASWAYLDGTSYQIVPRTMSYY